MDAATLTARADENDSVFEKRFFREGLNRHVFIDWTAVSGWSKESERDGKGSFEEERRGEKDEKKNLKAKREDERGGNEIRVFVEAERMVKYGSGSSR